MITTSRENWQGDIHISDYKQAGLLPPSKIRTAKIVAIDAGGVLCVAGRLGVSRLTKVNQALKALLAS